MASGFTKERLNNRALTKLTQPYRDIPGLMSGELQAQCQDAFRQFMRRGDSPEVALQAIREVAGVNNLAAITANASFAISRPCEDYADIFKYAQAVCEAEDPEAFGMCQDTTRWILESNALNVYLCYQQAPLTLWSDIDGIFELICKKDLVRMAVIFDDVATLQKLSAYSSETFSEQVAFGLSRIAFDPLSSVRAWLNEKDGISMQEIQQRIALQVGAIEHEGDERFTLSRCLSLPTEHGAFIPGEFSSKDLQINAADHMLRHLPRYHSFVARFPDALGQAISELMSSDFEDSGFENLLVHLIRDMAKANTPLEHIHFRYCQGLSIGAYFDLEDSGANLLDKMVREMMDVSEYGGVDSTPDQVAKMTLLGLVNPKDLERHAITDVGLRSAYLVTRDQKYLKRLSSQGIDKQISSDLGL